VTAPNPARAIAHGLVGALTPALAPDASVHARDTARDVAQLMGLDGLDAVLSEMQRMQGTARPADLEHVTSRLARLAAEAESEGSAAPFQAADAELAALARALRETEWSDAAEGPVAIYAALDVLSDLPLQPNTDLPNARLSAPVAASLRAALEWIGADEALLVQAVVHDSALSLTCPVAHAGGLGPAGAVLATVEGGLAPESDGRWTLRVPLHVERPSFLLLRVGHIPVALPWHSVARMRMLPPADWAHQAEPVLAPLTTLQPGADERPGALVALGLSRAWFVADRIVWRYSATPEEAPDRGPFAASSRVVSVDDGEQYWVLEPAWLLRGVPPTAVAPPAPRPRVAHGAHSHGAEAPAMAPAGAPAVPGPAVAPTGPAPMTMADLVARAVETLRHQRATPPAAVPPPSRLMPRPELGPSPSASRELPRPAPPESPSREMARSASLPPLPPSRELPRPEPSAAGAGVSAHLTVLRPEDVQPRESVSGFIASPAPPSREMTRLSPVVVSQAPQAPSARPASPVAPPQGAIEPGESPSSSGLHARPLAARRALVADDSLVARIFLARLLERRGFVVEAVGDGAGLWNALRRGPWSLVCADVTMPDAHGRAHLERLLDFRAACREPFQLVALTRDADEEHDATLAGAALHLRKPFDPGALDSLLDH
jgi:CheY-like chemotaxis protein